MANEAINTAAALCRKYEGLYLKPYLCPAGVPTIGYGTTVYQDGIRVTLKDAAITEKEADALLIWRLANVDLPAAKRCCPALVGAAWGAIGDFCYNLGEGNLRSSTLRKAINAGDYEEAKRQLMRWNKAAGKVLRGLTLRRADEASFL